MLYSASEARAVSIATKVASKEAARIVLDRRMSIRKSPSNEHIGAEAVKLERKT